MDNKKQQSESDKSKDSEGVRCGGGAPRPDAGDRPQPPDSMGSLVTPHAEITGREEGNCFDWSWLASGVDSLDLGGYVTWGDDWDSLLGEMEQGKSLAALVGKRRFLRDTCCGPCLIHARGKAPMYAFHLEVKGFHLFATRAEKPSNHPNVYVSVNSKTLWGRGVRGSVSIVSSFINELGGSVDRFQPSRVDLCSDYHIPGGLDLDLLRGLGVPGNILTTDVMLGSKLETFYIGSPKASIRARVYDKAKEVVKHCKTWFKGVWGIDKTEDVWRVEFQLRRAALKAYGVDTVDRLLECLGGIWADLSANWYSVRLHDDSNTSRRSIHPWWQGVEGCADKFGDVVEVKRTFRRSGNADAEYYGVRAANLLPGFAVCLGILDRYEAVNELADFILSRWTEEEFDEAFKVRVVEQNHESDSEGGEDDIPF